METVTTQRFNAVLLDIEGTTTPISFVYDTLFPYARRQLATFVEARWGQPEVEEAAAALAEQSRRDQQEGLEPPGLVPGRATPGAAADEDKRREAVVAHLGWEMDQDMKRPVLKALQGQIWRAGYEGGDLESELFDDVAPAMARWRERGLGIYIYSSGSVEAQRLLFGHTAQGDLRGMIDGYFDLATGSKKEAASYREILAQIGIEEPGRLLFATDNLEEAEAARQAGVWAVLMVRPGNPPIEREHEVPIWESFEGR